jgi:hypothetical protein
MCMAADLINAFLLCVVVVGCQWRRWVEYLLHLAIVVRLQLQLLGFPFFLTCSSFECLPLRRKLSRDEMTVLQWIQTCAPKPTSCRCRITVTLARWAGPAGKLAPRIGSSNGSGCRSRREKVAVVEVSFGSVVAGSLEDRLGRCFSRYSEASFEGLVAAANSLLNPSSFAMAVAAAVAAAVVVSKRCSVEVTATARLGVEDPEISALG